MIEKIKRFLFFDIEKWFLNNITRVAFDLILIITTFQIFFNILEIQNYIVTIWWIIVFWYWYKKYERDKELEIIDKYNLWKLSIKKIDEIGKWEIIFLLHKK